MNRHTAGRSGAKIAVLAARCVTLVMILSLAGCALFGWAADVITGGGKQVEVDAEYRGLDDKTVAVFVAADEHTLLRYPNAPALVAKSVGGQISDKLSSTTLLDPRQIVEFQKQNPYWNTLPYGDLCQHLAAQRIVVIDLFSYGTHDPENRHVWRGVMAANIGVVEDDSANPDAFSYRNTVWAEYPSRPVALLDSDDETIQLGMLDVFARRVAGLFHDHKEFRK